MRWVLSRRLVAVEKAKWRTNVMCALALIGILWLGACLRLEGLGATSLWGDEIYVVIAARAGLHDLLLGARSHVSAPPLDYLVIHVLVTWLGQSEFVVRLASVMWSIASIPLVYLLGKRVGGRPAGLAAALFLAVSPFHVEFTRQAKFYGALVFFTLLSNILFLQALTAKQRKGNGWLAWAAHAGCNVVGIYFHPFIALVLLAQGANLVLEWGLAYARQRLSKTEGEKGLALFTSLVSFLVSGAITGLAFVPWFLWDIAVQEPMGEYHTQLDLALGARIVGAPTGQEPWTAGLLVLLALLGVLSRPRAGRGGVHRLMVLHLAMAVAVVWLDNMAGYWFAPKQLLFALPAWLVLAGAGVGAVSDRVATSPTRPDLARWAGALALGAVVIALVTVGTAKVAANWYRPKQDWRGTAQLLSENVAPGDAVVGLVWAPVNVGYYAPSLPIEQLVVKTPGELARRLQEHGRLWYVRDWGFSRDHLDLEAWIKEQGFATVNVGNVLVSSGGKTLVGDQLSRQQLLEQANADHPSAEASLELGQIYLDQGLLEQARVEYKRVVALEPAWGIGHTKLGNVYRALGWDEEAAACYRQSIEVDPDYLGAYINLAAIYDKQGKKQDSLTLYEAAVEVDADSAWAHGALGSAYLDQGNATEGLTHLERAVELEPDNVQWLLALADAYLGLGQSDVAAEVYHQVLALDPGNRRATEALATVEP